MAAQEFHLCCRLRAAFGHLVSHLCPTETHDSYHQNYLLDLLILESPAFNGIVSEAYTPHQFHLLFVCHFVLSRLSYPSMRCGWWNLLTGFPVPPHHLPRTELLEISLLTTLSLGFLVVS